MLRWRKVTDFEIALYTWDDETSKAVNPDHLFKGEMQSFAKNHNLMAKTLDWDVYICGADDLYPSYGMEYIEKVAEKYPDKLIWVADGLFNRQPTHPIITRGWYEKYGFIFDEDFRHNFCDTDLFIRALKNDDVIKSSKIGFDHRHFSKTGKKPDKIYRIGQGSFEKDKKTFISKHWDLPDNEVTVEEAVIDEQQTQKT
jgi:hypothetical protein